MKPLAWAAAGLLVLLALYVLLVVILAGREAAMVKDRFEEALSWTAFDYESTADGAGPLHALAVWPADRRSLRLLVLMHGYSESAADYFSAATHWARQGRMVILPDMRGRVSALRYPLELLGRRRPLGLRVRPPGWRSMLARMVAPAAEGRFVSAGRPDSGGLEVHDIRDAVLEARRRLGDRLESGTDIIGYSGGGTSALLAAIRFPGLFERVVAFFPIVDFAAQEAHLRRLGRGPLAQLHDWLGRPGEQPGRFAARRLLEALGNLGGTPTLVLGDREDALCPVAQLRELEQRAAAVPAVEVRISAPGDPVRWHHGTPDEDTPLAVDLPVREPEALPPRSEPRRWVVPGYLVTPELEVWLGDGQQGLARCELRRDGKAVIVRLEPIDVPVGLKARVRARDAAGRWQERNDLAVGGADVVFGAR